MLVHELGHAYGLHEQYDDTDPDDPSRNGSVSSVMDAATSKSHCDTGTPTTTDILNVIKFYERGTLTDFTQVNNGDGTGTVTWLDSAWAEKGHEAWTAYRLSSTHDWKSYGRYDYHDSTGGHKDSGLNAYYRLKATLDLTTHQKANPGVRLPDVSQYVLCGRVVTAQYGGGRVTCSDYIEVSNAAHNNSLPTPTPTPVPPTPLPTPKPPPTPVLTPPEITDISQSGTTLTVEFNRPWVPGSTSSPSMRAEAMTKPRWDGDTPGHPPPHL